MLHLSRPCSREPAEPESSPESPLQPFPGRPGGSSDARPDVDAPRMSRSPFWRSLLLFISPLRPGESKSQIQSRSKKHGALA